MRFPYQRSVGGDLRELYKYERLRQSGSHLGNSSIDEGTGALEVRDADGDTTVSIGDLPDGGTGIAIEWGGELTNLTDILDDLDGGGGGGGNDDEWDERQDLDIAGLRVRASNIENTTTLQGQRANSLDNRTTHAEREIDGLRRRIRELEIGLQATKARAGQLERDTEQHRRGFAQLEGRARRNGEWALQNQFGADTLQNLYEEAMAAREEDRGEIEGLKQWRTAALTELDALSETAWRAEHEVIGARGGYDEVGQHIGAVSRTANGAANAAANAQSAASAAQSTANSAASAASSAQSSANQANDRITDARGSYGSLASRLNAMTSATSSAQSDANSAQSTANTALSRANAAQNDVDNLASSVTSALNGLVNAVEALYQRVAAIDGGPSIPP